jgi:hypothetical protein
MVEQKYLVFGKLMMRAVTDKNYTHNFRAKMHF